MDSIKTEEGCRKLEDLLRTMEHMEQRRKETGQFVYDFSWIRKELGM